MKNILKILVCFVLGTLTTSCIFVDDKGDMFDIPSNTVMLCEPANETHYSVYCIRPNGTKASTLVPYIYVDEMYKESDVVDAYCVGEYLDINVSPQISNYYSVDGIGFIETPYKVILYFDTYMVHYYFNVVLPKTYSRECKNYEPSFELTDYKTKELGDEEDGDKLYYCTEATFTLRAYQGGEVFDFVKTVKLRQEYVDVTFNISIDGGFDGENNI